MHDGHFCCTPLPNNGYFPRPKLDCPCIFSLLGGVINVRKSAILLRGSLASDSTTMWKCQALPFRVGFWKGPCGKKERSLKEKEKERRKGIKAFRCLISLNSKNVSFGVNLVKVGQIWWICHFLDIRNGPPGYIFVYRLVGFCLRPNAPNLGVFCCNLV